MPIRTFACAMLALACVCQATMANDPPTAAFDAQRAQQYITFLSRDDMQGRMSCTQGYRKAADWAAAQFRAWGLAPAGEDNSFFQQVIIRGFDWYTGVPALQVGARQFHLDDGDFSINALSTAGVRKNLDVVFVGYGISAPKKGLDEYGKIDVQGKAVLVLTGSPKDAPEPRAMFYRSQPSAKDDAKKQKAQEDWKDESTNKAKIRAAYEHGAAAVLLFNPDTTEILAPQRSRSRGSRTLELKPDRDFLCFTITERVFRAIMKQDPQLSRRGLKRQVDAMRREIKRKNVQSRAIGKKVILKGYDTRVRFDDAHKNNIARNVLAKIEGSDPKLKNQFVIAGAHLDHIGMRNGYVYNGADDNASGSAVVLELARTLAQMKYKPKRTIVFCLWCGEERGLLGSRHYVKNPCGGVQMDQTVAYFNMDMVGMGTTLGAPGALNFPSIWKVICRDQAAALMKRIEASVGGPGGSDHSPFIQLGIESLALMTRGGGGHPDYHQPEDDADKIETDMLEITGQFVLRAVMNLADETKTKLIIPRRKELYDGLRIRVANFNPELEGSAWTRVDMKADTGAKLRDTIHSLVREIIKNTLAGTAGKNAPSKLAKKSLTRGLASLQAIGTDEKLLDLAVEFYGIGRVDVKPDDSVFFKDGQLTDDGKTLIGRLEQKKIVFHLIAPSSGLLKQVADVASKPFIASGVATLDDSVTQRLKQLGCPIGVTLDPEKVSQFIEQVELLKKQLGQRRQLFVMLKSNKGLDKAKQALYLGLLDRGWARDEIVGSRDHAGLLGGATLKSLPK